MKYTYMGLIEFPTEFLVNGEVIGQNYITQIGNTTVLTKMPVIDKSKEGPLEVLRSPFPGFDFDINWGYVVNSKTKVSFVKAAAVLFQGEEKQAQLVYSDYTKWLYRFMMLARAMSHDLVKESNAEPIQVDEDGKADKYTGIYLYRLIETEKTYEYYSDNVIVAHLDDSLINNTGISDSELKDIMKHAGSTQPISQGIFWLSEAAIAYLRGDNTSCVILSSMALEDSILERVKKYRKENNIKFTHLGALGKKFKILTEYGINIPIADYKTRIVDFRNSVVHQATRNSGSSEHVCR